jgi:hypothetical protein
MSIVFIKPEVIPEVRPDPSPSRNDIQSMIDSMLERQAKSINGLLRSLIEEWDRKKFNATSVHPLFVLALLVLLKPIHTQVVHQWVALQCLIRRPASEPLPQPNHHRWLSSYYWDVATNYGQHVRARVYTHHV